MSTLYWILESPQTFYHYRLSSAFRGTQNQQKVVTDGNGDQSDVLGNVTSVPVMFEGLKAWLDSVMLHHSSFYLAAGRRALKRLGSVRDFRSKEVRLE